MKKIISIILAVCVLLTAFSLNAAALQASDPDANPEHIYFADYGQFIDARFYCWTEDGEELYEWPGISMDAIETDEDGNVMYHAAIPEAAYSCVISDSDGNQTFDIRLDSSKLIIPADTFNEDGVCEINEYVIPQSHVPVLYKPTEPFPPYIPPEPLTENLIVLDDTVMLLNDPITICCRSDAGEYEEVSIKARAEHSYTNGYGDEVYRFIMPEGMRYFYFTDGEKRTEELTFTESIHLYLSDNCNENGEFSLYDVASISGFDPDLHTGATHTVFDRFYEEYITKFYEGEEVLWSDVFSLYDELYYHYDSEENADWVLLHVESLIQEDVIYQDTIGHRKVTKPSTSYPFISGYGIYDFKEDTFVPVNGATVDRYDGLAKAYDIYGEGEIKDVSLYEERFKELYLSGYDLSELAWGYKELYYHHSNSGELDWVLVYATSPAVGPIDLVTVVGNRVLNPGNMYSPFDACYGIYLVKDDRFIDAGSAEAKGCEGFLKVFDKIDDGRLIGDLDNDNAVTVVDATLIQRCEVMMRDYPEGDIYTLTFDQSGMTHYYSDFNRDGERDILDATCIQRYLIDLPYSTDK